MQREELAHHWDIKAADWDLQVGETGDANRRLNTDPVIWRLRRRHSLHPTPVPGGQSGLISPTVSREGEPSCEASTPTPSASEVGW